MRKWLIECGWIFQMACRPDLPSIAEERRMIKSVHALEVPGPAQGREGASHVVDRALTVVLA